MDNREIPREAQQPPATPDGGRWEHFCRRDDPGAATRWFPGKIAPAGPRVRNPYRVTVITVDEDDDERCRAGAYLYWSKPMTDDGDSHDNGEEIVGPVRPDGERVLEELQRQHPEAEPFEVDTLFDDIVESMLTKNLIAAACGLERVGRETPNRYASIDHWARKVEDAAEQTRSWRLAHG